MSGSGTTSGELNSNTESTFTIFSENLESAFASTHRQNANNTLIINLNNRELKPGGGGYAAFTAYIGLRLRLGGSPVNPFGAPFASNSFAQGSMPKIEGYFEHQQAFNGTLVVAWSFRVVNPDGEIETHSSTDPGRPLNLLPSFFTETTMLFNETNDTQIPNYSFILPEVFSLDNQSSLTTAMSGFGVGGSISSGYCSAGVASSSFFAWNSPRKSPSINYLCQFALALTPVVFHGIYQW